MIKRFIAILFSVCLLWVTPTFAATAKFTVLTLDDAILLALRYNPNIRNAEVQRVIDKFNLRLAENRYEVQYALTGSDNFARTASAGAVSEGNTFTLTPQAQLLQSSYGTTATLQAPSTINQGNGLPRSFNPGITFSVTQPLLQGFGRNVNMIPLYNAQDAEITARLNLKNTIIQNVTSVISQYTTLVQATNTLKTLQLGLTNSITTLNQFRAQVKAGQKAAADLVQFQVTVANQQLSLQQAQVALQTQQYALLMLLGLNPNTLFSVTDDVTMGDMQIPTLDQSIRLALQHNIAYQQAIIALRALHRQVLLAHDQTRPTLNLQVQQTQGSGLGNGSNANLPSLFNGQNGSTSVGLSLTVPISNLPARTAEVAARVALKQAEITLSASKDQLVSNVSAAYYSLVSQKLQIDQANQALQLAGQNLNIANVKLKYGKITPFEASSLQTDLINAQINYINTKTNYISSLANFDQLLGTTTDRWQLQIRY